MLVWSTFDLEVEEEENRECGHLGDKCSNPGMSQGPGVGGGFRNNEGIKLKR